MSHSGATETTDDRMYAKRTINLHTKDIHMLPRLVFPSRSRSPANVVVVFGNVWHVTKKWNHPWRVSSTLVLIYTSRLRARDAHLSVRFFVQLEPIFQSPPGINDRKDGANNTGIDVCTGWERGALAIVADRNTPQYIAGRTSRERDVDVSNLLVLIKKSHKVSARPWHCGRRTIHHNDDLLRTGCIEVHPR